MRVQMEMVNGPAQIRQATGKTVDAALRQGVEHWHGEIASRHFAANAAQVYHYEKRDTKYMRRKQALFGHQKPLVFSGRTEEKVLGAVTLRGGRKQASATLSVPRYFYERRGTAPDKVGELFKTLQREREEIGRIMRDVIEARLAANRAAIKQEI